MSDLAKLLDENQKEEMKLVSPITKKTICPSKCSGLSSSAKARCEWDALHFDPTKHKLHEFLDVLQKQQKKRSDQRRKKSLIRAIYTKIPDHVKKILNRAYLEDKPYNDIVLHLEEPAETTLIPLNAVDAAPPDETKDQQQRGRCFHCGRYGHYKV